MNPMLICDNEMFKVLVGLKVCTMIIIMMIIIMMMIIIIVIIVVVIIIMINSLF